MKIMKVKSEPAECTFLDVDACLRVFDNNFRALKSVVVNHAENIGAVSDAVGRLEKKTRKLSKRTTRTELKLLLACAAGVAYVIHNELEKAEIKAKLDSAAIPVEVTAEETK